MFADDLALVKVLAAKYGPFPQPIIECGGLLRPTIADYQKTVQAMAAIGCNPGLIAWSPEWRDQVAMAQRARYLDIERPLSFLGPYEIQNPELPGGLPLERLAEKYNPREGTGIGTAVLLSVLEHVADPFEAIERLRDAMQLGGLAIVSVPFEFPHHPGNGEDNLRFTPTGLRHVFSPPSGEPARWSVLECDWRLNIPASAGVLNINNGEPQAIRSCYIAARAV